MRVRAAAARSGAALPRSTRSPSSAIAEVARGARRPEAAAPPRACRAWPLPRADTMLAILAAAGPRARLLPGSTREQKCLDWPAGIPAARRGQAVQPPVQQLHRVREMNPRTHKFPRWLRGPRRPGEAPRRLRGRVMHRLSPAAGYDECHTGLIMLNKHVIKIESCLGPCSFCLPSQSPAARHAAPRHRQH